MLDGTVEILSGKERRRRWGLEEKLRIVTESNEPGATVRAVAARHDIYPSLLHTWRRHTRKGRLAPTPAAMFVPVRLAEPPRPTAMASSASTEQIGAETIEIMFPDGCRLRVGNAVSATMLRRVIAELRR